MDKRPRAFGKYRIKVLDAATGRFKRSTPWIDNLVVMSDGYGLNLVARALAGLPSAHPLEIKYAGIGTGTTPPADGDTGLETPVLQQIVRANRSVTGAEITFEFFIADIELANGTYNEFALFCGTDPEDLKLYARSIITSPLEKDSNEDISIEYVTGFTNDGDAS